MRTLVLVPFLSATLAFAAEPTCPDRVKRLGELSKTIKAPTGPRPTRIRLSEIQDTPAKTPVRIVDRATISVTPVDATRLAGLARKTSVELCVETNNPITPMLSKEANPAVLQPLLDKANDLPPLDRATLIVGELEEDDWGCKPMNKVMGLVYKEKKDRLAALAKHLASTLTACKCPLKDGERAFAVMTLAADAWDDTPTLRCVPLLLGAADAERLTFGDSLFSLPTLGQLLDLVEKSGTKGVNLGK